MIFLDIINGGHSVENFIMFIMHLIIILITIFYQFTQERQYQKSKEDPKELNHPECVVEIFKKLP